MQEEMALGSNVDYGSYPLHKLGKGHLNLSVSLSGKVKLVLPFAVRIK